MARKFGQRTKREVSLESWRAVGRGVKLFGERSDERKSGREGERERGRVGEGSQEGLEVGLGRNAKDREENGWEKGGRKDRR